MAISDEHKKEILEMWDKGMSGSAIGHMLGMSRNVVIGYVNRARKAGIGAKRTRVDAVIKLVKTNKALPPKVTITKPRNGVSMDELRSYSCRFIINDTAKSKAVFCGDQIDRGSYCKEHADLCYRPAFMQRKDSFNTKNA